VRVISLPSASHSANMLMVKFVQCGLSTWGLRVFPEQTARVQYDDFQVVVED